MTEPIATTHYELPLQVGGRADRNVLNQALQRADGILFQLAIGLAATDASIPRVTPFGPFTATDGQTDFPLGVSVPDGAVVVAVRDGFSFLPNGGITMSGDTLVFAQPCLEDEIVQGYVFVTAAVVLPPIVAGGDNEIIEVPTGTIDSTNGSNGNGVFTLAHAIVSGTTPRVVISGFLFLPPGADYNWSGNTITFTAGNFPVLGESLTVLYEPVP